MTSVALVKFKACLEVEMVAFWAHGVNSHNVRDDV